MADSDAVTLAASITAVPANWAFWADWMEVTNSSGLVDSHKYTVRAGQELWGESA